MRNALAGRSWLALREALERLDREGCRVAVLSGAGGTFCSGADLADPGDQETGTFGSARRLASAHRTLRALGTVGYPVLAAVEGYAVGIGWALALACDVVVAAEDAVFLAPFLSRGVLPDGGSWWRLERAWGAHRTAEVLLTGRPVTAAELHGAGLVSRVVPSGTAQAVADELAATTAALPRRTVALAKRMLREGEALAVDQALDLELQLATRNATTGNPAEGRAAFLERRAPRWP